MGVRMYLYSGAPEVLTPFAAAFARDDAWELASQLREPVDGVETVIDGQRSGWTLGLIEWLRGSRLLPADDFQRVERSLAALAGPEKDWPARDILAAYWAPEETRAVATAVTLLLASRLPPPPPEQEWLGEMAHRIARLGEPAQPPAVLGLLIS
jgi:hypothetical protein